MRPSGNPTDLWTSDPALTAEIMGRVRASIALASMMLIVAAGLILIHLAFKSWRRVDNYLRNPPKRGESVRSAWEHSAERMQPPAPPESPESLENPDDDENDPSGR